MDIIARHQGALCFIEVKTRAGGSHGSPLDAISWRKRKRVAVIAEYYLNSYSGREEDMRFDVIGIEYIPNRPYQLEHLTNAFERAAS